MGRDSTPHLARRMPSRSTDRIPICLHSVQYSLIFRDEIHLLEPQAICRSGLRLTGDVADALCDLPTADPIPIVLAVCEDWLI